MNQQLDQAAMNHTTTRTSTPPAPPQGRIVFSTDKGVLGMRVTNSGVSYSPDELNTFGEMIQVLQAEGQMGDSGTIPIANLMKM